jgi:hypothetical protein
MLTMIALAAITTYFNNSGLSYRKAITSDRISGVGVVGAIVFQECDRGSQAMTSWSQCDRLTKLRSTHSAKWCMS